MSGAGIAIARDTYPSVRFEALRADVMSADRLAAAA